MQSLAQDGRPPAAPIARQRRQVQQQQVHSSVLQEHARHRQRLFQVVRREDDEPLERDASRGRLDRVQAPAQVQVGGQPAGGLDLGNRLKGERGLAARAVTAEGRSCGPRQTAQPQDGVQGAEAAGDGPLVRDRPDGGPAVRRFVRNRLRRHRERAHHFPAPARSCPTPAFPQGRQSRFDVA
jgi:hypothetical protein